jgi:hypothetical protein
LKSHRDAAVVAQHAVAEAVAKAVADSGTAGSQSLSAVATTSNTSCSISPGKHNADDVTLSSISSGSDQPSSQDRQPDKGKQQAKTADNVLISVNYFDIV